MKIFSTPHVLLASRFGFAVYFALLFGAHAAAETQPLAALVAERVPLVWCIYLLAMYGGCEYIYGAFRRREVDLVYAFPLVFAVFILNGVSLLVRGQEQVPIINRAEHFTSFVLLGYMTWVFFLKYLPHDVWQRHPYYTALLTLSVTSLFGVANEVIELVIDQIFGTQTVGAGYDTSLDLLMNTLGSGLFLAVSLILHEGNISFSKNDEGT